MDTVKIRVLFVVDSVAWGGMEKHVLDLIRKLDPASISCTIVCFGPDVYSQRLKDRLDVRVVMANRDREATFFSYWRAFTSVRPNVIVFEKGWFRAYPLRAFLAAKLSGAKRVVSVEHVLAPTPPPGKVTGRGLWNALRRLAGWRARQMAPDKLQGILVDRAICVSNALKDRLVSEYEGFPPKKVFTVWNGIDLNYFDPVAGNHCSRNGTEPVRNPLETTILCVSRFEWRKRIDLLLEAFSIVLKDHPFCRCVIVGTGDEEAKLLEKTAALGISASVSFAGFAEDVRPFLQGADIYVSASNLEGFGISILEAMAFKLPCVVTNIAGHSEIVVQNESGLLVPPDSAYHLADGIKYLLDHKEERARMGINGRKRVEELFDIDNSVAKLKTVLFQDFTQSALSLHSRLGATE